MREQLISDATFAPASIPPHPASTIVLHILLRIILFMSFPGEEVTFTRKVSGVASYPISAFSHSVSFALTDIGKLPPII